MNKTILIVLLLLVVAGAAYTIGRKEKVPQAQEVVVEPTETETDTNNKTVTLQLFFPNHITDPNLLDCNVIPSVSRSVPYTKAVAAAAINELIKGPTAQEIVEGFTTQIDLNTTIRSLSIKNAIAYIDLSKEANNKNVGLCAGQIIRAQIRETLLQFPSVKDVQVSIDGDAEFVQP